MAKVKQARDRMMRTKTRRGGLLMVHTGKGKGKTTAAMGLAIRAIGRGQRVYIAQFIKGAWETGETHVLRRFPDQCTIKAMGEGFTWETQDRQRDIAAARAAWEDARRAMDSGAFRLVTLDELNIVLRYGYLPLEEVLEALRARPPGLHVVVTGRNAHPDLIALADMTTEMTMIRHHFRDGYEAQEGVEF